MSLNLFPQVAGEQQHVSYILLRQKPKLVPQIRFTRHGNHRLRDRLGERQETRPEPPGENYGLHGSAVMRASVL